MASLAVSIQFLLFLASLTSSPTQVSHCEKYTGSSMWTADANMSNVHGADDPTTHDKPLENRDGS